MLLNAFIHIFFHLSFSFSFFFFFTTMFTLPYGDIRKSKTLRHNFLVFGPAFFVSSYLTLFQRYSLPIWQFLGKSLNFRELKTFAIGGNHSRSRYFPFLKPTHGVIPY
jgi:hypothetical protein